MRRWTTGRGRTRALTVALVLVLVVLLTPGNDVVVPRVPSRLRPGQPGGDRGAAPRGPGSRADLDGAGAGPRPAAERSHVGGRVRWAGRARLRGGRPGTGVQPCCPLVGEQGGPLAVTLGVGLAVLATAGAGVVLVLLRLRSGSLLAPVLLRLAVNGLGTLAALAAHRLA
ncbi:hypothetical protein [Modestobacter caceresii]|uniref:hypothetical protein n=1 Tax=Modestobacter caceresii TaxID=1522368 RepID=UPI0012E094CA|nr:hypothetical protein [Modestobacter caceresii]